MKKLTALILALALVLACCSTAFAAATPMLPYTGDEVTYNGYAADLGITEDRNSDIYKAYKKLTGNVTINWSTGPWADFDTKTATFLNTGDLPDIVWLRNSASVVANYGSMGYFLNLMDYIDYMPNLKQYLADYPQLSYLKSTDGALYCVNDIEPNDYIAESFYYNKTELDKLGLTVPKTWDEMLEAMRAYKKANPNGTPFITYGWGLSYYEYALGSIENAKTDFYYDGSKWTHPLMDKSSGYYDLIDMMAQMYKEGLLHPEFSTMSDEQAAQIVTDGNWLFSFYYIGAIYNEIFQRQDAPYDYEPMLNPAYKTGDPAYQVITVPYDNIPGWGYFINANVKNPELMCSLLDTIISKDASTLYNWGVEGLTYELDANGNKVFKDDFATNTDHAKAVGLGNFMDVRYIQYKMRDVEYAKGTDAARATYDLIVNALIDGSATGIRALRGKPLFSDADAEIVANNVTPMTTYIDENIMYFIDGTRAMDEWDAFVNETLALGDMKTVLATYEAAPQVNYSTERKYIKYGK